jgi:SPP1 gp7 family putative phage head morphogenesis protein
MDRQRHAAIYIRLMATKEIGMAKRNKKLLVSQGKKISDGFAKGGEHALEVVLNETEILWRRNLIAQYDETIKQFSAYTLEQINEQRKKFNENIFSRLVSHFIHSQALVHAKQINHTTRKIIKRVIQHGQDEGLGNEEIARNIKKKVSDLSDFRARTIARTETHNAATYASQTAAENSEQELIREWVAVEDKRTREEHADANGQMKEMDQPFDVGGEQIDRPGEGSPENSINCRCSLIYIPKSLAGL